MGWSKDVLGICNNPRIVGYVGSVMANLDMCVCLASLDSLSAAAVLVLVVARASLGSLKSCLLQRSMKYSSLSRASS